MLCVKQRYWIGVSILVIALSLCLFGCQGNTGNSDEPDTGESQVEESIESDHLNIPEKYFLTHDTGSANIGRWGITDFEGNTTSFEDEAWKPLGSFQEGYVFVTWETSEYDKEWNVEHDQVTHFGLVDKNGQMAIDMTENINALQNSLWYDNQNVDLSFSEGKLILNTKDSVEQTRLFAAIDTQGNVSYTVGEVGCTVEFDPLYVSPAFHDGVLYATGPLDSAIILNTDGDVLARSGLNDEIVKSFGEGYMGHGYNPTKVTDYSGNVLFDVESINIKGDIEKALIVGDQPNAGGLIEIRAEKVNPYGGANKILMGLYSVSASKWIVPLSEGYHGDTTAYEGLAYVTVDDKKYLIDGYAAEVEGSKKMYSCLMDYEGNIVLDQDDEALSTVVQDSPGSTYSFACEYLGEGFWKVAKGKDYTDNLYAYFENGALRDLYYSDINVASWRN